MDAAETGKPIKVNRWLPYWAVLQEDIRQTLRSWVYRVWILVSALLAGGYLLYRVGVLREAGIVQHASTLIGDLLRWCVLGSATLIVVLAVSSISAERGTVADSVLSRGISRYQFFLGKWHSRLCSVLGTFLLLGAITLSVGFVLLHGDLSWSGSILALVTVMALLAVVVSSGVTMSAICNSTLVGIAILWVLLFGVGFGLTLLPAHYPSPYRVLTNLSAILRGEYDLSSLTRLVGWALAGSILCGGIGIGSFARRDV